MKAVRVAFFATLLLVIGAMGGRAQDVTLKSHDGDVEISGDLLGFDGEFYRVDTIYGELTIDGSGVTCAGPGCPNLENFVARVRFSGAPSVGRVLLPALLEAFAIRNEYKLTRHERGQDEFAIALAGKADGDLLGEFTFSLTNTDEGFADLLAHEADIAMARREVRPDEIARAREAGLGNLTARGRSRVIALDALVPVTASGNPVETITMRQLAQILSGDIDNWTVLGGPDAPISVHLHDDRSGLGQAAVDRLLVPQKRALTQAAMRHQSSEDLIRTVLDDPFALGITGRSEHDTGRELALSGKCGFALRATRRAIKTEDYPLTAPMFLYLPARRFPKIMREFLAYLRDPSAQLVIRRAGFVDQAPEEIRIDEQGDRFANAILRAGAETALDELQRMVSTLAPLKRLSTTFRFETGSARLDAQSRSNVQQLARALETGLYDARRLVFVGFSDGEGPASANRTIAMRRADAVKTAVIRAAETANLDRIGIEVEAFGEAMPMACDDSAWGRQINRRVEVWLR